MVNKIDHFALGAASLEQGQAWVASRLGVKVPRGGKHDTMGTHNCVTQAGRESFFEILAIDHEVPAPARSRWFTLDEPATRTRLARRPQPLCWVVGTDDLDSLIAASPVELGEAVLFRRGERWWRLTLPKDGSLPEAGLLPAFIQWSPGPHPSTRMQDLGLRLITIKLQHPRPAELRATLAKLGVDHLAEVSEGPRGLAFQLDCRLGEVTLY